MKTTKNTFTPAQAEVVEAVTEHLKKIGHVVETVNVDTTNYSRFYLRIRTFNKVVNEAEFFVAIGDTETPGLYTLFVELI